MGAVETARRPLWTSILRIFHVGSSPFLDAPTGENRRVNVQKVQDSGMMLTPYKQDYKKLRGSFVACHMPYRLTYEYTQLEGEPAGAALYISVILCRYEY